MGASGSISTISGLNFSPGRDQASVQVMFYAAPALLDCCKFTQRDERPTVILCSHDLFVWFVRLSPSSFLKMAWPIDFAHVGKTNAQTARRGKGSFRETRVRILPIRNMNMEGST